MKYDQTAKRPSFVIPPGEYSSQIIHAEEKVSKKGNPMLVVEHTVFNPVSGQSRDVTDYMVIGGEHSAEWKIGHLCASCGLPNTGDLVPAALVGRNCRVRVKITPAKGDFPENNAISDYLVEEAAAPGINAPIKPAYHAVDDGSVPF